MICKQCGALIDDNTAVCDNCGFKFESDEREIAEELSNPQVPAVLEDVQKENASERKGVSNLFVKIVAVLAAIGCFWMFFNGAVFMDAAIANTSGQSFMGGIFGSSGSSVPAELFAGLRQAFIAMGIGFSGIILILGFKKN